MRVFKPCWSCKARGACYPGCECAKCVDPEGYERWKRNNPHEYAAWRDSQWEEIRERPRDDGVPPDWFDDWCAQIFRPICRIIRADIEALRDDVAGLDGRDDIVREEYASRLDAIEDQMAEIAFDRFHPMHAMEGE